MFPKLSIVFLIGSVTDDNKETAPPTAASVAEELLSLWQNSRPDHNCNSVVCEVENSAWGQGLPIFAVVADLNESEEEDESADSFTWADFDSSGN